MIPRGDLLGQTRRMLDEFRVVGLLGPRQCGKTTLARQIADERSAPVYDLERPDIRQRLAEPRIELEALRGLVVLDEAQSMPEIFSTLRGLADREPLPAKFLLLGSASPDLIRGASQSLAGRIGFVHMGPFDLAEVGPTVWRDLWQRGGFPLSFLASSDASSFEWRTAFIDTFVERDLRAFGLNLPPLQVRRFWTMLAHSHGELWNGSQIAGSMGFSQQSARRYLDVLTHAFMLRQLPPWFENVGKRVVKSPKVYIRDTGLLHALLGLSSLDEVASHPKLGASFEGFVVEQIIRRVGERNAWFWATHGGAELDLLVNLHGRRFGFEVKWTDSPRTTKSMHSAMQDLKLDALYVVHPGLEAFPLGTNLYAVPVGQLDALVRSLV